MTLATDATDPGDRDDDVCHCGLPAADHVLGGAAEHDFIPKSPGGREPMPDTRDDGPHPPTPETDPTNGTEVIRCWCGDAGRYDELFDDAVYDQTCGGSGYLECECAGDFCACHHHGTVECPGCDECGGGDCDDYDPDDYDLGQGD